MDAHPVSQQSAAATGQNEWLVEEMYAQYQQDPTSVSESWRDFFADYRPFSGHAGGTGEIAPPATDGRTATAVAEPAQAAPAVAEPAGEAEVEEAAAEETAAEEEGEVIRGVGARIVENMEASLGVPTATSFREVPARLLEVNRKVINGYLGRTRGGKVSFTHLIGYAVVRAIADRVPVMNSSFSEGADGKPRVIHHEHVNLGLAVDVEKADGSRILMVVAIKKAEEMDFRTFVETYEDLIRRVRANKVTPDDLSGVTVSLTNPGGFGTLQSVPRLMPGQGVIVGVGTIDYPTEFQAADQRRLADLGVSKVITLTSTYDHRIIQGAESGLFLKRIHELLIGEDGFYEEAFRSMGVPYEAVQWRRDVMPIDHTQAMLEKQVQVNTLINMHRVRGHLIADLDPLRLKEPHTPSELDPATYGLTIWDLDREFYARGIGGVDPTSESPRMPLGDLLGVLRDAYCRTIGVEYMHIQEPEEKAWIQGHVESRSQAVPQDEKLHILGRLNAAEALERFLATKYVGQKRFGLEGGESAIVILDALCNDAADEHLNSVVMGMAHRGRLNVLVNIVGKSYEALFEEFEGGLDEDSIQGSGDVKYHLGQTGKFQSRAGNVIPLELAANPSHLEAVDPVVLGMARARMDQIHPPGNYPVLPLIIHGDAAFAGQGVVAESLNLSQIRGYKVGGAIHLVINNQVGFTTTPDQARSSVYATDVAKMVQAPIFHVNGDDPEACVRVAHMAFAYRQEFDKDVVIDMWCYRRHGHNEGDDPSYTQPLMYRRIEEHRSVRKLYVESLVKRGDITLDEAEAAMDDFRSKLQSALDATRDAAGVEPQAPRAREIVGAVTPLATGVDRAVLARVVEALSKTPEDFVRHPKLDRQLQARDRMFAEGEVDWALAESLAFGTLLLDGVSIRLAGQDSRRGTFSHRHSTLVDYDTGREFMPLEEMADEGEAKLWIYDSLLSEYAALGFEYGYSVANTEALVIWEAQFGDFMNGAQIIIDQFLVAGEDKWDQHSGLTLLLPHGLEGQGPEHSSARMERFLLLAAEDNINVVNASTAAQYFHALRRQAHEPVRRPLVMFTPKSLLRAKSARSSVSELTDERFRFVLHDTEMADPDAVRRILFATGKVSHEAIAKRNEVGAAAAIERVEQLYPWPAEAIAEAVARYPNAREIVWLQEEPENMGGWNAVKGRFYEAHGDTHQIRRVSRPESGSPATGSAAVHAWEQAELLRRAFDGV